MFSGVACLFLISSGCVGEIVGVVFGVNRPAFTGGSNCWEDGAMGKRSKYSAEVRERAVRLVMESEGHDE